MLHTFDTPPGARRPHVRVSLRKNLLVAAGLVVLIAAMSTLVAYSVPLYRLFCQVTGFGGTTRVATVAPGAVALPPITVRFDANVANGLPWRFIPPQAVEIRLGEQHQVTFTAANLGNAPILGTATFNVTPGAAGKYFNKIQCFCFTEQLLMPGESKELPVVFFVDPAIAKDADAHDIGTITLSYTFFNKGRAALERYLREHPIVRSSEARQ